MAKPLYHWNKIVSGDIISFRYNKLRRTVLVVSPRYLYKKTDRSTVQLMSGLQLETQDQTATQGLLGVLKQLGNIVLVDEVNEIYKVEFDRRRLDAKRRNRRTGNPGWLSANIKILVTKKYDLFRTYDYLKMRKESPSVFLDDLESLPRKLLKEAAK